MVVFKGGDFRSSGAVYETLTVSPKLCSAIRNTEKVNFVLDIIYE